MSLRAALDRALATRTEVEAGEEQELARRAGCTLVRDVPNRTRAQVAGVLRSVTVRPSTGRRALAADLYDGSGTVTLIFLGRREIPGIEAGRHLLAEGLVAELRGRRVMFNPRYELRATA